MQSMILMLRRCARQVAMCVVLAASVVATAPVMASGPGPNGVNIALDFNWGTPPPGYTASFISSGTSVNNCSGPAPVTASTTACSFAFTYSVGASWISRSYLRQPSDKYITADAVQLLQFKFFRPALCAERERRAERRDHEDGLSESRGNAADRSCGLDLPDDQWWTDPSKRPTGAGSGRSVHVPNSDELERPYVCGRRFRDDSVELSRRNCDSW